MFLRLLVSTPGKSSLIAIAVSLGENVVRLSCGLCIGMVDGWGRCVGLRSGAKRSKARRDQEYVGSGVC